MNQINVQFDLDRMTVVELAMLQRLVVGSATNRPDVLSQVTEAGVTLAGDGYADHLDRLALFVNSPVELLASQRIVVRYATEHPDFLGKLTNLAYEQQAGRMKRETAVPEVDKFAEAAMPPMRRVMKAMDEAAYQTRRLREDQWAGWAAYLLERLDEVADPDGDFLTAVRDSINARLEEGSW
jgi:hypothetical protein